MTATLSKQYSPFIRVLFNNNILNINFSEKCFDTNIPKYLLENIKAPDLTSDALYNIYGLLTVKNTLTSTTSS